MKKFILFIQLSLSVFMGFTQTQTITLTFTGEDAQTHNNVSLQSIFIRNITQDCDTAIYGGSSSVTLINSLGIYENSLSGSGSFSLMPNISNPFNGSTNVYIRLNEKGKLQLSVSNTQGKKMADYRNDFPAGLHKFEISSSNPGLLILNVTDGITSISVKLINSATGSITDGIRYLGPGDQNLMNSYKFRENSGFIYHLGDSLLFKASSNGYYEDTITAAPVQSTSYTFQMTPMMADGYYVKGAATAYPDLNANTKMAVTLNEVTQTPRISLLELYIPVKAGTEGFNIVLVESGVIKTFGPGAGFGFVTNGTYDEPKVPFQRGPYAETAAKFTVPADGIYHVVIDYEVGKVVIVPVHWGIIGAATPSGWITSTNLTESTFNFSTISWDTTNLELRNGEWKFRYSDGWKVELDTIIDLGGGNIGVKVNSTLGGSVDALVSGGNNIVNGDPGLYTFNINYTLGSGYNATLTKTGNIPHTDWTGVKCDAVGFGISIDNPAANVDTSSWQWGNQMLADNIGIPVVSGDLYTWRWTSIILEAYQGFQVRTVNGIAPPSGGANFAAGYAALNVGASAAEIIDDGGNLMATVKGTYNITLVIDAANNDIKEIIIVFQGDGYYVKGAATAYPPEIMKVTRNEVTQTDRPSLLELYIPVKACPDGFNIVQVDGAIQKTFGPGNGFGVVTQGTMDEPKVPFQRGPYAETTAKFTVPSDGMYHVVIDYELGKVVIVPVHWGMIGGATPHGWVNDTIMTESAFNATDMSWTLTGLTLLKGEWKFRYSHGWKVELDTTIDLGGGKKGVKVNANFGNAVNALVPGGSNIVNTDPGFYTCNLSYSLGSGYSATLTKTGNIPPIDYSQYQMGIIGNCYLNQNGTQASWDENFGTSLPVVNGTDYTWTYTIDFNIDNGEFKFRQGNDWSGKSIGYGDVTWAGTAASYFTGNNGNIIVGVAGNYTLVLKIDAATEIYTVTATKN